MNGWQANDCVQEAALDTYRSSDHGRTRPVLPAETIGAIERAIRLSCTERRAITLRMYDRCEDLRVIGIVDRIDSYDRRICVGGDWFRIADVIGVE